jgi:hypothetical protein
MKIRSSIYAGAQACPEAQHYQQQALAWQQKVYNCVPKNQTYVPPATYYPYVPPTTYPYVPPATTETGTVGSYPDMSGYCG